MTSSQYLVLATLLAALSVAVEGQQKFFGECPDVAGVALTAADVGALLLSLTSLTLSWSHNRGKWSMEKDFGQ